MLLDGLSGLALPVVLAVAAALAAVRIGWTPYLAGVVVLALLAGQETRRRADVRTARRRADAAERRDAERAAMLARTTRALRVLLPAETVQAVLLGDELPSWSYGPARVDVTVLQEARP